MLSFLFTAGLAAITRSDEALLVAIARGDRRALKRLYERLAGQALAVALRVLRSRGEAEEIVQDVFVEVWQKAGRYDPARGSPRTWVLAIVRNRSIDLVRSRQVEDRTTSEAGVQPDAPTASPLEEVEARQVRERIRQALSSLPPEQRRTLELAYFEGLSQSEIAERLSDPIGTVKSRIALAMRKLLASLGDWEAAR
jgi:RNA polymerase sigma-70 factor (ECF subfamily)